MSASYTTGANTGYLPEASTAMSGGQVEELKNQALAQKTTVHEESARAAASAEQKAQEQAPSRAAQEMPAAAPQAGRAAPASSAAAPMAPADGSTEARVYGDIAMDFLGIKALSDVGEFFSTRHSDTAGGFNFTPEKGKTDGIMNAGATTFDRMLNGASGKKADGEDILMRANIAHSSLNEQGAGAVGSWSVKESKLKHVEEAKRLTYSHDISNEMTMKSAQYVQQQHAGMMFRANQLAPGLGSGMASGPTIRPEELLRDAQRASDDKELWRSGA